MAKSKNLKDDISEETRKKIADEEFREIVKIANGHKKTLSALAKHWTNIVKICYFFRIKLT